MESPTTGGEPIPQWPVFSAAERAAVDAVLASGKINYWTGEQGRLFEKQYAAYLGTHHAVALMNGSVALELALRMWGIGAGDDVIVTPRSFIASTSCVVLLGARPIFADVDPDSGNITADTIARVLTPRTRAVIPVHLGGWPCDLDPIMSLASRHGFKVLEDCAQAHGAFYKDHAVGSIGHAAAFSFCQDKIISTGGEGGMLATDDRELWDRAWSFKDHGKTWEAVYERQHGTGFRWVHDRFGTNWRMTEPQAAIGRIQLDKLPEWSERRRANAQVLIDGLKSVAALRVVEPPSDVRHAYYRFYVFLDTEALKSSWTRDRVVAEVAAKGIPCLAGSCSEIYREKAFDGTTFRPATALPVARKLGDTSIALLVHPTLTAEHMERTVSTVTSVVQQARR